MPLEELELEIDTNWYLVRTKAGKERVVRAQLERLVPRVFLPLLRTRVRRRGKLVSSTVPLFPCYLLARFALRERYYDVRYSPGVQHLVSAGRDPIAVPDDLVAEIERRGVDGVVELDEVPFAPGESVRIIVGPLSGFEGVFDKYLSGPARVAILLRTVESAGFRVVLPAGALERQAPPRSRE
jgi:transcription antitermination factor NusG